MGVQKKGELPILVISSVVLALVGISLYLVVFANNDSLNKAYCSSFYKAGWILPTDKNGFCEQQVLLQGSSLGQTNTTERTTAAETSSQLLHIPNRSVINLTLRKQANVSDARISLRAHQQVMNRFNGSQTEIRSIEVSNVATVVRLPQNAILTEAKMSLMSPRQSEKLDLVFIFDMSGSTRQVFNETCNFVSYVVRNLSWARVNVTIYELQNSTEYCTDSELDQFIINVTDSVIAARGNALLGSGWADHNGDHCGVGCTGPFDDVNEAWGLMTYVAAQNHPWQSSSRRIIIPVSDSDPTGSWVPICGNNFELAGNTALKGNEYLMTELLINASRNKSIHVYPIILPYKGVQDIEATCIDSLSPGYCTPNAVMGTKAGWCAVSKSITLPMKYPTDCVADCHKIIGYMTNVSTRTSGRLVPFDPGNVADLTRMISNSLYSDVWQNVTVSVDNQAPLFIADYLPNMTSLEYNNDSFVRDMKTALAACTPDASGMCDINLTFTSNTTGNLVLSNLRILYYQKIEDIHFDYGGILGSINETNTEINVSFVGNVTRQLASCTTPMCTIKLNVTSSGTAPNNYGTLFASNIKLVYSAFDVLGGILDRIINCWERSGYGSVPKNQVCETFQIPAGAMTANITEMNITKELIAKKKCSAISNNIIDETGANINCGRANNLNMSNITTDQTHVLIEYRADLQQVVVS